MFRFQTMIKENPYFFERTCQSNYEFAPRIGDDVKILGDVFEQS